MSEMTMPIRMREGTAAEWSAANPILLSSEMGREKDTNRIKFGDGTTAWLALVYFGAALVGDGDKGDIIISGSGSLWKIDISNLQSAP